MVPINIEDSKMQILAQTFGCTIGSMPFTYLGLPLGTTKTTIEDFLPLVSKCEKRLVSTSIILLSQEGRLQLTNSVSPHCQTFLYVLSKCIRQSSSTLINSENIVYGGG
jgi:hypothetical protein